MDNPIARFLSYIPGSRSNDPSGSSKFMVFLIAFVALIVSVVALVYAMQSNNRLAVQGKKGDPGVDGVCTGNCINGENGTNGRDGRDGRDGTDCDCDSTSYAQFQSFQPYDNPDLIYPGGEGIEMTTNGPFRGSGISRFNASTFLLVSAGHYRITFLASVTNASQLALEIIGSGLTPCMGGRFSGFSQISFDCLLDIVEPNSKIRVVNPPNELGPIYLTPSAGGSYAIPATLIIEQK